MINLPHVVLFVCYFSFSCHILALLGIFGVFWRASVRIFWRTRASGIWAFEPDYRGFENVRPGSEYYEHLVKDFDAERRTDFAWITNETVMPFTE